MAVHVPTLASDLRLVIGQLARRGRAASTLPLGQLAILGLLDREGAMTTSEVAARQGVRHQSAARTVGQLVALSFVGQRPDPDDARKTLLTITPAGTDALRAERERRVDWLADAIERELTPAEQELLARATALLQRLPGT